MIQKINIKKIKAREIECYIKSQIETVPYLLYKDKCNQKSNQKNLGTIQSSNLCTIQYTSPKQLYVI